MNYEKMAEVLNLPIGTVKTRLFRARRLLRDRLVPVLSQ
jgi:DNA-directed RNA polymerase specialized sigma24 family protein